MTTTPAPAARPQANPPTATPDADASAARHPAPDTAEQANPAVYVELTFGTAMRAKIWISPGAPDAFHAALDFARTACGAPPPRGPKPGPIKDLIDAGRLTVGQTLTWYRRYRHETHHATVTADARLRLADGTVHTTANGAALHITGYPTRGWHTFTTADGTTLAQLIASLSSTHPGGPGPDRAANRPPPLGPDPHLSARAPSPRQEPDP